MIMIKTVKVKKKLRLDELIKYAIEKGLNSCQFTSNNNVDVYFSSSGYFLISGGKTGDGASRSIQLVDTFTVEVEEEITEDTIFEEVYRVTKEGEVTSDKNKSINDCLDWKDYQVQIFAMLDGKLQLIWEENK